MRYQKFISIIVLSFVIGCAKLFTPVTPSWDITLNGSLASHSFSIKDILDKNPGKFQTGDNGVLVFNFNADIPSKSVGDALSVDGSSSSFASQVGAFDINDISISQFNVTASNLGLNLPLNFPMIIPPFPFDVSNISVPSSSDFQEATISTADITVTLQNNIPCAVNNLSLIFSSSAGPMTTIQFPSSIPDSQTTTQKVTLTNVSIQNNIKLHLTGALAGTGTTPAVINNSTGLAIQLTLQNVKVTHAIAKIPQINFAVQDSIIIDTATTIQSALIKSGTIDITAKIPFDVSGVVTYTFPDLTQKNSPFIFTLPFNGTKQIKQPTISLAGYELRMSGSSHALLYNMSTTINSSGNNMVTINSTDQVTGTATFSKIVLQSFTGIIKPTTVAINQSTYLDVGSINKLVSGHISLTNTKIQLVIIAPPSGLDYLITGSLRGKNSTTGASAALSVPTNNNYITGGNDTLKWSGTEITNFLNTFLPKLPDSIILDGAVTINPGGNKVETINDSDSFGGNAVISLAAQGSLVNVTYSDTASMNWSKSNRDDVKKIDSVSVSFEFRNSIPFTLDVDSIVFYDSLYHKMLHYPKPGQALYHIGGSQIDQNGFSSAPTLSFLTFSVTGDDIQSILNSEHFVPSIRLNSSSSQSIALRTTDSISISMRATLNYRVEK